MLVVAPRPITIMRPPQTTIGLYYNIRYTLLDCARNIYVYIREHDARELEYNIYFEIS